MKSRRIFHVEFRRRIDGKSTKMCPLGCKLSTSESEANKFTIKQIKICRKKKTGTILRLSKKNFKDGELVYELFLTTRQTTKIKNVFANNMSTDVKLTKSQIYKIFNSGGSFGSRLANLGKKH